MRIIEVISDLNKLSKGCVLTIGNFDGVHIGHKETLTAAKQTARQNSAELVVMTFQPHPLAVLRPQKAPGTLTPLVLKEHLLAEFGIDCLFVLKSTTELLSLSPVEFVDRFVVENIQPGVVVEGEDFNFGSGRGGSIHTLQRSGAEKGFEVSVIKAKEVKFTNGEVVKISSTIIRNLLVGGKAADAAIALSRPYRLMGKIIPGRGKGTQLGFPTLNLEQPGQIVPAEGVYAGLVEVGESAEELCGREEKIPAVFSIGRAGTYGPSRPLLIEAHLLIEDVGDLVGRWMAMDFVAHIRSQHKFKTGNALADQIKNDCQKAKKILANVL